MRFKTVVLSLPVLCLVFALPASATNIAAGTDYFMAVSNYASGEQLTTSPHYYVGLTTVTIYADNAGVQGPAIGSYQGFCIDYQDVIHTPVTYLVVAQGVGSSYDAALGGVTDLNLEQAAAVGKQFDGNLSTDIDAQIVAWDLGGAGFSFTSSQTASFNTAKALAATSAYTGVSTDWAFEQIGGDGQSFMVDGIPPTITTTPEPSSFVLLGTGILGTVGVLRRRFMGRTHAASV